MKRLKLLLLFGLMLPLLASCGKSEEATLVDNLILNIGQVTLDSGAKIREAEKATKELDEKQYKQLEYLSVLQEARNTYDNLRDEKRINDIEEAIGSIGEVTLESEQNIKKIRNQYDTSNDKVKQGIKNYAILEEAEQVISSIKIQNVTNLIEQIGNVTLDSKEIIDTAKSAYSKLSFEEQGLVSNYNLLEEALDKMEALKEQAEQQEVENALSKLKKEVDKVENMPIREVICCRILVYAIVVNGLG